MSGTHGVFQHRSGYFYTILEEDFCEVYKAAGVNEVCRAYITTILEHLTNKQVEATGKESDIWVYMSLPEMARRMRHAFSERTIHKEIQGMIKEGYLTKRRASGMATMEYKLNLRKIRKALEALPEIQSCKSATYNLANLQEPSGKSARSILQNYKNDLADLQPRLPREETKDIPREEERALQHSTENARALSESENDSYRHEDTQITEGRIAAFRTSVPDGERGTNDERLDTSHHPVPNLPDKHNDHLHTASHQETAQVAIASMSGTPDASPPSGESRQSQNTLSTSSQDGAATDGGGEPRASDRDVTQEKLRILDDWEKVIGRPLSRNKRLMAAAEALVPTNPTREELEGCLKWLPTTDRPEKPWYKRHGIGLEDIVDKLDHYRSHLALSIEPAPLADVKQPTPMDIYTANSMNKEKMARRIEEMKANAAKKGLHFHGTQ